jgi:hypothetical protein
MHKRANGKLTLWYDHDESASGHNESKSTAILTGINGKIRLETETMNFHAFSKITNYDTHEVFELTPEDVVKALAKPKWKIQ